MAYSNEVKMNLLHVSPETLEVYGAVSEQTVIEMVKGAMKALKTDCAVATSGIAGPGGGTPEKPVGTVLRGNDDEIRAGPLSRQYEVYIVVAGDGVHQFVLEDGKPVAKTGDDVAP